jgi:hypothetical protein
VATLAGSRAAGKRSLFESGSGVPPGWYKVTWDGSRRGNRKRSKAPIEVNKKYMTPEKTPLEIEVKDNPEPGHYDLKFTRGNASQPKLLFQRHNPRRKQREEKMRQSIEDAK